MINISQIKCGTTDFYSQSKTAVGNVRLFSGLDGTLVILNASRDHIPYGVNHRKVGLNEKGKKEAMELGRRLVKLPRFNQTLHVRLISSPVERCIQTCEYIIEGLREAVAHEYSESFKGIWFVTEIVKSRILGAPGPFVVDEQAGTLTFERYGTVGTVELLQKGTEIPGFCTLEDGSQKLMELVKREFCSDVATIIVTHDAILAPFINNYTGEYFNQDHWIDFLDGVLVTKNGGNGFHICRNNEWWTVI